MEEKRVTVKDLDRFWTNEDATFNSFMEIIRRFRNMNPNVFCDEDNGNKTSLYLYLNKGFKKRKLNNLAQQLYKELVELLGEATKKEANHEEGFYSLYWKWSYPTHCYCVSFDYVYDGYEEDYYDIDFDDDYDEEDYEEQELENHRIGCGIYLNEE